MDERRLDKNENTFSSIDTCEEFLKQSMGGSPISVELFTDGKAQAKAGLIIGDFNEQHFGTEFHPQVTWKRVAVFTWEEEHIWSESGTPISDMPIIPFRVREKLYVLENIRGETSVFIDHRGSFCPTQDTYIQLSQHPEIDPTEFIVGLMARLDFAVDDAQQRFSNYQAEANQHDLTLEFKEEHFRELTRAFHPMHCYALHANSKFLVRDALERICHIYTTNQDLVLQRMIDGIDNQNIAYMTDLFYVDVGADHIQGPDLSQKVSHMLLTALSSGSRTDIDIGKALRFAGEIYRRCDHWQEFSDYPLPPFLTSDQANMALAIQEYIDSSSDNTSALAATEDLIARLSPDNCLGIDDYCGDWLKRFLRLEHDLAVIGELKRNRLRELHREGLVFDENTRVFLEIDDFQGVMKKHSPSGYWLRGHLQTTEEAPQLWGGFSSEVHERLVLPLELESIPPVPIIDVTVQNYPFDESAQSPIWEAILRPDTVTCWHWDSEELANELIGFNRFLDHPSLERQCNPETLALCRNFFKFYAEAVTEYSQRMKAGRFESNSSRPIGLPWRNYFGGMVREHPGLSSAMREVALNYLFAYQMNSLITQAAQYLKCPFLYPPKELEGRENYLMAESNLRPFQLLIDRSEQIRLAIGSINYSINTVWTSSEKYDWLGIGQLLAKWQFTDEEVIVCRDFPYRHTADGFRAVEVTWEMSREDKRILRQIAAGVQQRVTNDWNRLEENGNLFLKEITRQLRERVEMWRAEPSIENLQCAYEIAHALYSFWNIDDYHINLSSGGELGDALRMVEYLEKLIEIYIHPVYPLGKELKITSDSPVIILAPHEEGKSTVIRGLATALLLNAQRLPTPGGYIVADRRLRPVSILGRPLQQETGSMFTGQIPGINNALTVAREQRSLLLLDEFGKHTNSCYGEALLIAAIITAYFSGDQTLMLVASHYLDLPQHADLFRNLGIEPQFLTLDNYQLHPIGKEEKITSKAARTIGRYLGKNILQLWPYLEDLVEVPDNRLEKSEDDKMSENGVFALTKEDLLGKDSETRQSCLVSLFDTDGEIASVIDHEFLVAGGGEVHQNIFLRALRLPNFSSEHTNAIKKFWSYTKILDEANIFSRPAAIRSLFGLDKSAGEDIVREKVAEMAEEFNRAVDAIRSVEGIEKFVNLEALNIKEVTTLLDVGQYFRSQLRRVAAFADVCSFITRNKFQPAIFTDEAQFTGKRCWNPLLLRSKRRNDIVANNFEFDFSDNTAGTIVTGENCSGKSNYCRGDIDTNIFFAQTLGFAPGKLVVPRNLLLLSLTQPSYDDTQYSGMAAETVRRIKPALNIMGIPDKYILTVIDDPGTPTSPEDAPKLIHWLYRYYHQYAGKAKLLVTTHCNEIAQVLDDEGIRVNELAFLLLHTNKPFTAFTGRADSNAFEVARRFELDELLLDVAEVVFTYLERERQHAVTQADVNGFAAEIRDLMTKKRNA